MGVIFCCLFSPRFYFRQFTEFQNSINGRDWHHFVSRPSGVNSSAGNMALKMTGGGGGGSSGVTVQRSSLAVRMSAGSAFEDRELILKKNFQIANFAETYSLATGQCNKFSITIWTGVRLQITLFHRNDTTRRRYSIPDIDRVKKNKALCI